MAIKIKFDTNDIPENPTFVLSKRSGDKIGLLSNITNIQVKDCLNSVPEVSFTVHKYDNEIVCPYWDEIKDLRLVWCKEWDLWFEMKIDINTSDEVIKNVSLTRLAESELSQTNLYNIEINTELDISRDDYTEPTIIYNAENPSASLCNRILDKAPHYSLKHVDLSIAKLQRTFTFDNKSIVDAFQEIATEINALVVYHSGTDENGKIERYVSLYDLESNCLDCGYRGEFTGTCPICNSTNIKEGYGEDTTICIDDENSLGEDITLEVDVDSVKNCFKLVAGDDLMTATIMNCNPNGTSYLWYLSENTKDDMSDELRDKINSYNNLYADYKNTKQFDIPNDILTKYNNLVNKYKTYNQDLENIVVPIIGYPNLMNVYYNTIDLSIYLQSGLMPSLDTENITASNQAELLTPINLSPISVNKIDNLSITTANSAVLGIAKILVHPSYKVVINNSSLSGTTWSGNFEVINMYDEDDSAFSNTINITINDDYNNFVNQKLDKILNDYYEEFKTDISSLFKKDLSDFSSQLRKYSLNGLNSLYDACQSCLDILIEQGVSSDTSNDLYNAIYLPYYNKLSAIQSEINLREQEINIIVSLYDDNSKGLQDYIDDIKLDMQDKLNFEKYIGADLWTEFCSFRREDTYENTNYISDGLDNADLFKNALEFIDIAQKEIYKSANLQHKLTSTLNNLLVIKEFRPLVKYFSCGNWIRIKIDDTIYKLRLLEYNLDFDNLNNFDVTFSDVTYGVDGMTDTKSILDKAGSIATSYDSVKRQASQGADGNGRIQNWIYKGLDATTINIINRSENQTQSWDKHGMLYRQYDDITESYLDTQLKIINQGLYITDDNWKTTRTGIGKFIYLDPKDKKYKDGYGVIADTICSNLILSEEVGIYNPDSSIVINKDGISVSDPNNTSSNKPSVTITPDGKLTCNGATIRGDIIANSLTLTDSAMNGLVNSLGDDFVPFNVPIENNYGEKYFFQVDRTGFLQAKNAYISGTVYTSKLVGCTIDVTDGINFRGKDKIYYKSKDPNGNIYITNEEEVDLNYGSIYKTFECEYRDFGDFGEPVDGMQLYNLYGNLYIDTHYDIINDMYVDNMNIQLFSGSSLIFKSTRNIFMSSTFDLKLSYLQANNELFEHNFSVTGGDITLTTTGINQIEIINLLYNKYGLPYNEKGNLLVRGLSQVNFDNYVNTLSNSQKMSLYNDIDKLQSINDGKIFLDAKNIYASCFSFEVQGSLGITSGYNNDYVSFYCLWDDMKNHNLVARYNDMVTCSFGWSGKTEYDNNKDDIVDDVSITKTLTILRGYTVRLACGGYGGGNSTSDEATRAIDFDFDSSEHALFRPTKDNVTYLGSGSYRWKEVWGVDGKFSTLYEGGTSLSNKYQAKGSYLTSSSLNNCVKTNSNTTITSAQITLGKGTGADGNNYYFNDKGTGRFDALRYTSLKEISARRYKENIDYKDNNFWHNSLMNIKPCTYNYIMGSDKSTRIGVIAEDLDEFMPELVEKNENNECEAVNYIGFIIPLVSEVQRLNNEIDELKQKLNTLIEG